LSKRHYPLEALTETFYPLQGFWNFILYTRPGVKRVKRTNPDKSCLGIFREVVFRAEKNEGAVPDAVLQGKNLQMLRAFDSEEIQESYENAIVMTTISGNIQAVVQNERTNLTQYCTVATPPSTLSYGVFGREEMQQN